MQQHRYTVNGRVRLRSDIVKQLKDDPSLRIMLYCAVEDFLGPFQAKVDVAFPHQVELKVNTEEIKANFRGLKNKPGSVRPVDITSRCRIIENYDNSVALTYALTHKVGWTNSGDMPFQTHGVLEILFRHQFGQDMLGRRAGETATQWESNNERKCGERE